MTMTTADDLTEAEARIRQLMADTDRKRQEIILAPRHLLAQLLGALAACTIAAGALISAGVALANVFHWVGH